MKKISHLLFTLIILPTAILMNCSKKKVENFPTPKSIFFVGDTVGIQYYLTEEPDSEKGEVLLLADNIKVVGSILIEKGQSTYKTYQIPCPTRIKKQCKSEFVYIRANDIADETILASTYFGITSYLKKYIILSQEEYDSAILTQKIIKDPKKTTGPINFSNFNLFNFLINTSGINADDMLLKVEEFYQLVNYSENPNKDDLYSVALVKKYPILKEKQIPGKPAPITSNNDFDTKIAELRNSLINSYIFGFPLRSPTFKGLVGQFNKMKTFPYLTEKLFEYLSKDGVYSVSGSDFDYLVNAPSKTEALSKLKKLEPNLDSDKSVAYFQIENQSGYNFQIKISTLDGTGNSIKEDLQSILSITAEESGNSLGFKVKTDKTELILSPLETTPTLLIAGQGFKEFLKGIPNDHKEILKNNDYNKAIMLIALKFGDGGFDESIGKMLYSISAKNRYWMMLDLIRFNPNNERTDDFTGTIKGNFTEDDMCTYNLKWRQPKGEFYLSGIHESCYNESDTASESSEELCFSEGSSNEFSIEFLPAELRADKPNIKVEYSDYGLCKALHHMMQ